MTVLLAGFMLVAVANAKDAPAPAKVAERFHATDSTHEKFVPSVVETNRSSPPRMHAIVFA